MSVAIVTGSSSGIGRAVALGLARLGHKVVVNHSSSQERAETVAREVREAGGEALVVQADVSSVPDCQRLVAETKAAWGALDLLVNNAGTTAPAPLADLWAVSEQDWDRIFGVNVKGAFFLAQAAVELLRESKGSIINVSSIAGINAGGSSLAYAASKAALNNLTKSLARGLAPDIRVNAVAPGFVDSPWIERYFDRADSVRKLVQSRTPTGRLTQPEHVAEMVLALFTGMEQVSGHVAVVDGGYLNQ